MKRVITVVLCLLLLSGTILCGCQESESREVSSVTSGGYYTLGLRVNEGDLKESGVEFEDRVIEFQDPVMEEMLRTIIGKPEGDVLHSDLLDIHAIYWRTGRYWSNLQSDDGTLPQDGTWWYPAGQPETLADLAYCDNLQWLEIGAIECPSLEPLYTLTQLEHLKFTNTVVSEERWEEITCLPALTGLALDFRNIAADRTGATSGYDSTADGSILLPLAEQLTYLDIGHKLTWSPEVLSQFTNLEGLNISYAEDLSFLASMPKLYDLCASDCKLSDWSVLGQMESLSYMQLIKCTGFTLEDLGKCGSLEQLILVMCDPTPSRQDVIDAVPSLKALKIY